MILKTGNMKFKGLERVRFEPYVMKLVEDVNLYEIQKLQEYVYDRLPNKEVLVTDSIQTMAKDLEDGGFVVGVYNGCEQLVAYRFVTFPRHIEHNLGADIALDGNELKQVAHLETTLVHPGYRGNSFQSETLAQALPIIESRGYRHVLSTVSPLNPYSLYNVMHHGLRIKALKRKYAVLEKDPGLWRFVLHRDLLASPQKRPVDWLHIGLHELEKQVDMIHEGFVGTWLDRDASALQYVKYNASI